MLLFSLTIPIVRGNTLKPQVILITTPITQKINYKSGYYTNLTYIFEQYLYFFIFLILWFDRKRHHDNGFFCHLIFKLN